MPSSTVENYAKQIFLQSEGGGIVPMGQVSEALSVSPGTATTMAKSLEKSGLADYIPREGVRLTAEGRKLALKILRRHRIVECFLVDKLKMDWGEVHEEAERLEHSLSDRVLGRIDAFLGYPRFDPHGDPIPTADGELLELRLCPLSESKPGTQVIVSRITAQDTDFLSFVSKLGLTPGVKVGIESHDKAADCMGLRVENKLHTLGLTAAAKVMVEA